MRKYLITCAALFGMSYIGHAQVGVGTLNPSESTVLDIHAKDRGVLFPRVHLTNLSELDPVIGKKGDLKIKGLIVFNINPNLQDKDLAGKSEGFYVWSGTSWDRLSTRSEIIKLIEDKDGGQSIIDINAILNLLINQTKPGEPLKGTSVVLYDFEKEEFYTLYKDEKGNVTKSEVIDLTNAIRKSETKSLVNRGEVTVDGQKPDLKESLTYDQTKSKKGQIFYEYLGEKRDKDGKQIPYYLDITGDVKNIMNNNEDVKNILQETINNLITEGGNVFYGDHDNDGNAKTDDVLYAYVENKTTGQKEKKIINLTETLREIFKNETFIKELKEAVSYNISSAITQTNIKYEGKVVNVFSSTATVNPLDAEVVGVVFPDEVGVNALNIFDIKLYSLEGKLITVGITDIKYDRGLLDFSLGSGGLYTPIAAGPYKVVIQFTK
ncbi:MAG: hypothetical protein ACRCVU_15785 [Flavobacterium sp.]